MRRKLIVIIWIFFLAAFVGCKVRVTDKAIPAKLGSDGILCDFENIKIWGISPERGFSLSLEKKNRTEGNHSLKVTYPAEDLASINTRKLFPDWSGFDFIIFDVYNPQDETIPFAIRIDDALKKRLNLEYPLLAGHNQVKISTKEISGTLNIHKISFLVLYLSSANKRITFYFDNMRLVKSGEANLMSTANISHPRLLFNKNELLGIKEKFEKGPFWLKDKLMSYADVSPYWEKAEFLSKKTDNYDISSLGFVFQLLGDKDYARQAIKNMLTNGIKSESDLENFAFGFDWCYGAMEQSERSAIVGKMERAGLQMMNKKRHFRSFHNTMYQLTTSIAACGYAIQGESELSGKLIDFAAAQYKDAMSMFNNLFVDGEWPEGMDYNRHIAVPMVKYFEIVKSATGKDLYKECDWLLKNAYFVMYTTMPDNTFYRFADLDLPEINDWERRFLVRVASYYQDPYIQWYVNNRTKPHSVVFKHIYDVLWYDPYLQEKPPYDLPKAKLFNGLGVVIARSGWGDNDTWFSFKCGDYFGDHCHFDQNSFTIYKLGHLAIDSGLYGDDFGGSHWCNYYSRSIAHNTVTVYDPSEKFLDNELNTLANDGGQKIMLWQNGERVVPENYSQPDPSLPITWAGHPGNWETGNIKAYKLTNDYCYVTGDATKAYSAQKLNKFIRQILFIFPDYFVIMDTIEASSPNFVKKWLLHTVNEPKIEKDEIFTTDGSGKLYCKALYPLGAVITKIGGEDSAFFAENKNYPHNDELFEGNIPGKWRIEITPAKLQNKDLFLNFLCASEMKREIMPKVEKIESDSGIGLTMELNGLTWVVIFNRAENGPVVFPIPEKTLIRNLIFNMLPEKKYSLKFDGKDIKTLTADKNGAIDFRLENAHKGIIEIELLKGN
jgi:hypothetical protein